jgi:hypothetical protein
MAIDTQPRAVPPGRTKPRPGAARPVTSPRHTRPAAPPGRPAEEPDQPGQLKQRDRPRHPDQLKQPKQLKQPRRSAPPKQPKQLRQPHKPQLPPRRAEQQPPTLPPQFRQQRGPFILLLVGLLGGALVSLLVISTTLDEGSFRINNLTQENTMLSKEQQTLDNEVQLEQASATIAQEAYQLGMRHDKNLQFVNTKSGTISSSRAVTP